MVKRHELKLNNRVELSNGIVLVIVGLSENYATVKGRALPMSYDLLYPIMLNGTQLLKLGWKYHRHNGTWTHKDCKYPLYERKDKYGFATKGTEGELIFFLFCTTVHELQNQFYILTKKNLAWKKGRSITNNEQND